MSRGDIVAGVLGRPSASTFSGMPAKVRIRGISVDHDDVDSVTVGPLAINAANIAGGR